MHDCESWLDEGRGCAICGGIIRGISIKDLHDRFSVFELKTKEVCDENQILRHQLKVIKDILNGRVK